MFYVDVLGEISTVQLNCLIYDKLLKIACYNKGNFNEGQIVNLIQADSEKLKKGFHVGIPDSDLFYRKLENFQGAVFKPDFFYLLDTKSLF